MEELQALIFDQDGVIADTERDGHRVAFNKAFKKFGFDFEWDVPTYGSLLKVGGGKERMRAYFEQQGLAAGIEDLDSKIKQLHKRKTEMFMELIESGQIGLRPGVARLVKEAHAAGLKLAVCSTSNEKAVHTLVSTLLGQEAYGWFDIILAGDMVPRKKPDPIIYNLAAEKLGVDPASCVVIEDNRNGLLAAKGAGMHCVVTVNAYTDREDFGEADLVVSCLGDAGGEATRVLASARGATVADQVDLGVLEGLLDTVPGL